MKRLRKLFCVAIATLWVLPVSAMSWVQDGEGKLILSGLSAPALEAFQPLSNWIVEDVNEYLFFESDQYQLRFEFLNAVWDSSSDTDFVIEVFDETGDLLDSDGPHEYTVNTAVFPNVLTIAAGSVVAVENYVTGLPANQPTAKRIQIKPTLILDQVQDCNQQVTMRTWMRYDNALVGRDEPDHTVIPSVFAC